MWKNIVEPERPHVTIWRTRISRWIPKATDTHSEYVTLIAFPRLQCLHEGAPVLRYRQRTLPVLFLPHSIGCRTCPACYSVSTGRSFLSAKAAGA
jgi:hypothetical protein